MKNAIIATLLLASTSAFAIEIEGKYESLKSIAIGGYPTAKACKKDGGKWANGLCIFAKAVGEVVTITATQTDFEVEISKVGSNAHSCDFSGKFSLTENLALTSKKNGSEDNCDVKINFTSADTISVETNGQCYEYCGAGILLDEKKLERVK